MKKANFLLVFVLMLGATLTATAQNWVTKNLDEKMSVKFPVEPKKANQPGVEAYTAKSKDSVAYSASTADFKVIAGLDSAALAPIKDTQPFADQLKAGISSSQPELNFEAITIGKWKNYTSYDMAATDKTGKKKILLKMILVGSKMYSLSCGAPVELVDKNSQPFFASVNVAK